MRVLQIIENFNKETPVEITDGAGKVIYPTGAGKAAGAAKSVPLPVLCREVSEVHTAYFESIRKYGFRIETEGVET